MADPLTFAATVLAQTPSETPSLQPTPPGQYCKATVSERKSLRLMNQWLQTDIRPDSSFTPIEFSQPSSLAPHSGSQLYWQRLVALKAGHLYTRLSSDSYRAIWSQARKRPSYKQWRILLAQEARAAARGQGRNRLNVMLGDSLSLWFPGERLPQDQFWLNQSLSGDTTAHILRRLSFFAETRPSSIYVMAGINDLKKGASDNQILWNMRQIVRRLQQSHPSAQIVVQSILPTRSTQFSNERILQLNQKLEAIAQQENVLFLDLHPYMADTDGNLHPNLTTDGIHLNAEGYATWQTALLQADQWIAMGVLKSARKRNTYDKPAIAFRNQRE